MTKRHFEILNQIRDLGDMLKAEHLRNKYRDADYIISDLLESDCIKLHEHINDEAYAGDYEITGKGYCLLTEYISGRQASLKKFLITDILVPVIVAAITAYITVCITS